MNDMHTVIVKIVKSIRGRQRNRFKLTKDELDDMEQHLMLKYVKSIDSYQDIKIIDGRIDPKLYTRIYGRYLAEASRFLKRLRNYHSTLEFNQSKVDNSIDEMELAIDFSVESFYPIAQRLYGKKRDWKKRAEVLYHWTAGNHSLDEIAELVGTTRRTVSRTIKRAKEVVHGTDWKPTV